MKKTLSHLPEHKRDELKFIVDARYKKEYKITRKELEYLKPILITRNNET